MSLSFAASFHLAINFSGMPAASVEWRETRRTATETTSVRHWMSAKGNCLAMTVTEFPSSYNNANKPQSMQRCSKTPCYIATTALMSSLPNEIRFCLEDFTAIPVGTPIMEQNRCRQPIETTPSSVLPLRPAFIGGIWPKYVNSFPLARARG